MDIKIFPTKLQGEINKLQSKSYAHRIIIAYALAENFDFSFLQEKVLPFIDTSSDDIKATVDAVKSITKDVPTINCHDSGTTYRLMLPVSVAVKKCCHFTYSHQLEKRPISPLTDTMVENGCSYQRQMGKLTILGKLKGGQYSLPGDVSSQFISGLLFALPLLKGDSTLEITGKIQSRPYVDMTLDILKKFNINIGEITKDKKPVFKISGNQKYISPDWNISKAMEVDWSNSAFWLAANHLGSKIDVKNLNFTSLQGDKKIVKFLCTATDNKNMAINMSNNPDLVPIFAVVAAFRDKGYKTSFLNISRLSTKESNRIESTVALIKNLGGKIESTDDTITVTSLGKLKGGVVDSFEDHRIAMAAAIAATATDEPVIITNAEAVKKSYPQFFEDYKKLGGNFVTL